MLEESAGRASRRSRRGTRHAGNLMRRHWSAMACLLLMGWQTPACSGSDQAGERSSREATAAERTTRHPSVAREAKRPERQSKVERIRPEPRAVARASLPARAVRKDVASVRLPSHLSSFDDLLAKLTPAQAIEKLEETMGPLEGAHYVLQRDSGVELVDDGWRYLEGELSLIDCRDTELAAQEPGRSFPYWVGGVRFSDAPDAIEPAIDGTTTVPLLGGPGMSDDPRWRDMHIRGTSVTRFGRTPG